MADRRARLGDVHQIAAAMPYVKRVDGPQGTAIYQVGARPFVFCRSPQPDAADPETGQRYADLGTWCARNGTRTLRC